MSVSPAPTTEWKGPTRFLPPPAPRAQADGSKGYEGVTYAVAPGYRPLQLDLLLIHGTADTVVRYAHSEVLAQALIEAGVPVQLVPIEGADHIFNGHDNIDGVVRLSVEYLAAALRGV